MLNKVKTVRLNKNLPLPEYKTDGSSGLDLYASVDEPTIIKSGERKLIKTGIAISIPSLNDEVLSLEAQIRPRSGLALKNGISIVNAPGTIDEDFRGEIGVILINHSNEDFIVNPQDRIAQIVFTIVAKMKWQEVETLDETERNDKGFGSTGTR